MVEEEVEREWLRCWWEDCSTVLGVYRALWSGWRGVGWARTGLATAGPWWCCWLACEGRKNAPQPLRVEKGVGAEGTEGGGEEAVERGEEGAGKECMAVPSNAPSWSAPGAA